MKQNQTLNAANAHIDGAVLLEVGIWLGHQQTFGLIANRLNVVIGYTKWTCAGRS